MNIDNEQIRQRYWDLDHKIKNICDDYNITQKEVRKISGVLILKCCDCKTDKIFKTKTDAPLCFSVRRRFFLCSSCSSKANNIFRKNNYKFIDASDMMEKHDKFIISYCKKLRGF